MAKKPSKAQSGTQTLKPVESIAKTVRLTDVSVVQFHGEKNLKDREDIRLDVAYSTRTKTEALPTEKAIKVLAEFEMAARQSKDDSSPLVVGISLNLALTYACESVGEFSPEALNDFGRLNGVYNAWPYWREFLQSSTVRMGLPPLIAPPFRIAEQMPKRRAIRTAAKKRSPKSKQAKPNRRQVVP